MNLFSRYNSGNEMAPRATNAGTLSHRSNPMSTSDCTPIPDGFKRCKKCGEDRPHSSFHRAKDRPDGLQVYCKDCQRAYYKSHREEKDSYIAEYREKNRDRLRTYFRGYYDEHREKKREYDATRYELNAEQAKDRARQYYMVNRDRLSAKASRRAAIYRSTEHGKRMIATVSARRRAKKKGNGGSCTTADLVAIRAAQTDKQGRLICWRCNEPITGTPHLDHWIPIDKGGTSDPGNLHYMHAKCNHSKNKKHPYEIGRLL
jgi:hypothetical protein